MPAIIGEWDLIRIGNKDTPQDKKMPWRFIDGYAEITDEDGYRSLLSTTFFKVRDTILVDTTATDPEKQGDVGKWWAIHVFPAHLLCKIQLEEDTLTITPLNYEWFHKNAENSDVKLPYITEDDNKTIVFTATSKQWISLLKKHQNTEGVFLEESAYVLRRSKTLKRKKLPNE
jgi:hypothetical protein